MDAAGGYSALRNPVHIGHVLMRLVDTRAQLSVNGDGNTQILSLDFQRGVVTLDDPHPSRGWQAGERLHLSGRVEGAPLMFDLTLRAASGTSGHEAAIPELIRLREQRSLYRVNLPSDLSLPASTLQIAPGRDLRARILDLSECGFGGQIPASLTPGQRLLCNLHLPLRNITMEAELRSSRPFSQEHRVGLRFCGLSPPQQRAMEHDVAQISRQLLRRFSSSSWL